MVKQGDEEMLKMQNQIYKKYKNNGFKEVDNSISWSI